MPALETTVHDLLIDRPGLCRIDVGNVFIPGGFSHQRVHVSFQGRTVGEARLTQTCALEFIVSGPGRIRLYCPDALRPCDLGINVDARWLSIGIAGVSVHDTREAFDGLRVMRREADLSIASTGLSPHDLAMAFESLGRFCELGMVQREMGAEPLGLLRFSNTPFEALLRLLEGRFKGLGTPGTLTMRTEFGVQEFIGQDSLYGLEYHTWQYATHTTAEAVLERDAARLPFLARKLTETLEDADKVMVFRSEAALPEHQARALLQALQAYGPNRLLVVEPVPSGPEAGQVIDLGHGLMRGTVAYASAEWWEIATAWAPVLARAYDLSRRARTGDLVTV